MSRSVISTLPSCMSLGWTKRMSSRMPRSFSRAAHTRPSKSERVTSRNDSGARAGGFMPVRSAARAGTSAQGGGVDAQVLRRALRAEAPLAPQLDVDVELLARRLGDQDLVGAC